MDARRLATGGAAGGFMESYVVAELTKQAAVIDEPLTFGHFRDRSGEVKSATSVNPADARGLRYLRDRLGDRFTLGLVLHTGPLTGRLDDRIWAAPVSALWGGE